MSIQVNISVNNSSIEIVRGDGRKTYLRKEEINTVSCEKVENLNYGNSVGSNPYNYKVYINLANGQTEEFDIQDVTNQPTWTIDLAGLNKAASDIAQSVDIDSNIDATLTAILAAIQSQSEYEAKLVVDNSSVTWLEVRIYNQGTGTFDPPVYYLAGSGTPGTPAAPITYINPNTYLSQIVLNTNIVSNVPCNLVDLSSVNTTFGAGKRAFSIYVSSGSAVIDGVTVVGPIGFDWAEGGTKNSLSGITIDTTSGVNVVYGNSVG